MESSECQGELGRDTKVGKRPRRGCSKVQRYSVTSMQSSLVSSYMCFPVGVKMINEEKKKELEAATFKRLVSHLQKNTDLQNIDLMNLAGFCRNCLSKWMVEEAEKMNITLDYEKVRADIYGMDYSEWKKKYQKPIE